LLSLRTRDYGPRDGSPLLPWIRNHLAAAGLPADGKVWLQTFPRIAGYAFNPVCFWYCHDAAGQLRAVLAEVNNTFGEHHCYFLFASDRQAITAGTELNCRKLLHVSPFCKVEGGYRFRFMEKQGYSLVRIDYHDDVGDVLHTAISGRLLVFNQLRLLRTLLGQPFLTFAVVVRIHLHALRLWMKKLPFYRKPAPPAKTISQSQEMTS
jgi:DUF1365 family protein